MSVFLCINFNLYCYKIGFIPFDANYNVDESKFFANNGVCLKLKSILNKLEHQIVFNNDCFSQTTDITIFFNIPDSQRYLKLLKADIGKNIIFLFEPPSVLPGQYDLSNLAAYAKVFTWQDDLVDNKKYIKFYLPIEHFEDLETIKDLVPFQNKKFCTMISMNKSSNHVNELYTARKSVINFFEKYAYTNFDLYGVAWPSNVYSKLR